MKNPARFYSSIPLILIGGVALYAIFLMGGNCGGIGNTYLFILASFVYLLALVVILTISIAQLIMKKQRFNFFPLITTAILLAILFITPAIQNWMESPAVLYAQVDGEHKQYGLELKKNHSFEMQVGTIEYGCTYKGDYVLKGDTIILSKNYIIETDSMFTDKYVIDKTNQTLYPIKKNKTIGDNSRWLRIILMKM
jgi:hypothetical protein